MKPRNTLSPAAIVCLALALLLPLLTCGVWAAPETFDLENDWKLELKSGKSISATKETSSLDKALTMTPYELRLLDAAGKEQAIFTYNDFTGHPMKIRQATLLQEDCLVILADLSNTLTLFAYRKEAEGWKELQSDSLAHLPFPDGAAAVKFEDLSFELEKDSGQVIAKDTEGNVLKPVGIPLGPISL